VVGPQARRAPGAALSAEPIFVREGDAFVPTGHARGPWDPGALHGGAPAALVAEAVQAEGFGVARLTVEFLGPVPLAPLTVRAELVRPGRRLQLVEAAVEADGRTVLRCRAVRMRRGEVALPAGATAAPAAPPGPDGAQPDRLPAAAGEPAEGFHRTGMEIRFAGGTDFGPGPALAWFRLARPLVDDAPASPLARVAAAADFGNGVSHVVPWSAWLFVNTDLTIHVHREPVGEWVLLDARTTLERSGTGLAWSALHDETGPLGLAAQSLYVEAR
jgi:Acyl-CoA thioesterase C-terminal domain/Acyl-CoA thioesterase N-terminal domain